MLPLLSSQQSRECDKYTIETLGIPELVLMEHAALGVTHALEQRFQKLLPDTRGVILAGPGNNGGDALAVARQLYLKGLRRFSIVLLAEESKLSSSCQKQLSLVKALGMVFRNDIGDFPTNLEWVVDGIFGTGLTRPLEAIYDRTVKAVNQFGKAWVVSIDIPSGLSSDTGNVLGDCVKASHTVALGFFKKGLVTGNAADYVGLLTLEPLQIPRQIPGFFPQAFWYEANDAKADLPTRRATSHKGDFGHVFVWAGTPQTQGAACLCSLAALRAGSGLVTVVGESTTLATVRSRLAPEIMTHVFEKGLFSKKGVACIGPGFGTEASSWNVLCEVLNSPWPIVIDADGITLLSQHEKEAKALLRKRAPSTTWLTPHPKEAARLLNKTVESIQADRFESVDRLAKEWSVAILLKGKGTLSLSPGELPIVTTTGNSSLSKGGSGDVLAGILASLIGQGVASEKVLSLAAWVHGRTAELMSQREGTQRAILASEIAQNLPHVWKELES